jgi:5-dehydro-2-deoxygluconokinase
MLTYEGYLYGLSLGIPKSQTAILTDDLYGNEVLQRAHAEHTPIIYTLEKSGQSYLDFIHNDWRERALRDRPDWIKTLVRYNPTANKNDLSTTLENLKLVSDFAHDNDFGFMIEPLVPPTDEQKDIMDFDHVLRPELTVQMIREIYDYGIYPNIWKIEGLDTIDFYTHVSEAISLYDSNARIVILGRNESLDNVKKWLSVGAVESSVVGFAVGRTVFLDAIQQFISGNITSEEARKLIGQNYYELYKTFYDAKITSN